MNLLLDTHAFLWFVLGNTQISNNALQQIIDSKNTKWVSPASYWEIAIKISIGKYKLNEPYDILMQRGIYGNGFQVLPILPSHTAVLLTLPQHHRDPFDRLLIAQAIVEGVSLVSKDETFDAYPISRIW